MKKKNEIIETEMFVGNLENYQKVEKIINKHLARHKPKVPKHFNQ
jgi:hypothetical protein